MAYSYDCARHICPCNDQWFGIRIDIKSVLTLLNFSHDPLKLAYNPFMLNKNLTPTKPTKLVKKTYFGISSLIVAVMSAFILGMFFIITTLNISPSIFFKWNNIIGLLYCLFTPTAFFLGILGLAGKNDSKTLSGIAMSLSGLPFIILFWQFVVSLIESNS